MKLTKTQSTSLRAIANRSDTYPGVLAKDVHGGEKTLAWLLARGLVQAEKGRSPRALCRYRVTRLGQCALDAQTDVAMVLYAGGNSKSCRGLYTIHRGKMYSVSLRVQVMPGLTPEMALDKAKPRKGETVLNAIAL